MVIRTNNLEKEIITEENGRQAFTMMDVSLVRLKITIILKLKRILIKKRLFS